MPSKKSISIILKFLIVLLAFLFLYNQLNIQGNSNLDIDSIIENIKRASLFNTKLSLTLMVFMMMFVNWTLEAFKWRFMIKKIENISIQTSLRAVFTGITVSSFTPNRIGEYGGRVFCLNKADRVQAALITVLGSMGQLLTTVVFGLIGLFYLFRMQELPAIEPNSDLYFFMGISILFFNASLVYVYVNASFLTILLKKISWLSRFEKYTNVFSLYSTKELLYVLIFSISRYLIFTTQFFILFHLFDIDIPYLQAIAIISSMLVIISVIPISLISPSAIIEIPFRFLVITLIFKSIPEFTENVTDALSATFILWIINLIIPTLIGSMFVFTLNFFRKK
tara:strand:- start:4273 stop:5286 length:1014 start_codon:yes stop_codon:yes gene_type:complete